MRNENNFDLVRLFAASNVMLLHSWDFFGVRAEPLRKVLEATPGVPIFFIVSGFLITRSWEHNPDMRRFLRNRVLRIYPALWVCFAVSLALAIGTGYRLDAPAWKVGAWVGAQLTIGPHVTPGFMSNYGTGSLNGALWTIPLELQFYVLTPLFLRSFPRWTLFLLVLFFAIINQLYRTNFHIGNIEIASTSLFPSYFYMFLIGSVAYLYLEKIRPFVEGRFWLWILIYLSACLCAGACGYRVGSNDPMPILVIPLAGLILAAAYSGRHLSERLLKGSDISYGIYLYHMPIINTMVETSSGSWVLATTSTIMIAVASWMFVEKKALSAKRRSSCG